MHSNFHGMLFVYVKAWYYIICYLILKNQDLCKKEMIMKKNLMLVLLFGLCVGVSAAFQYEIVSGSASAGISGSSFFVRIIEGSGSLYVLDKLNSKNFKFLNSNLLANNANMTVGNYGYVDNKTGVIFDGDGTTIKTYDKPGLFPGVQITQTGYKLGDFTVGDEIGIWLTDDKGKTGASILDKSDSINSGLVGRNDSAGTDVLGNELFELDFKRWYGSSGVSFGIHGVEGKPLPGILTTLLLGGGALGAMGMRKKRIAKA